MTLYFTDSSAYRQLQECNLYEVIIPGKAADNGVELQPVYRIYNKDFEDSSAISFGGETDIGKALRDAFWNNVSNALRRGDFLFDVDEWYKNIKFVERKAK